MYKLKYRVTAILVVFVLTLTLVDWKVAMAADPEIITMVQQNGQFTSDSWQLGYDAAFSNGNIRLTQASGSRNGSAFVKQRLGLAENMSFSTQFSFVMSNAGSTQSGADGLAFVIQKSANDVGSSGGGIGYGGLNPSIAIELDTYNNGAGSNGGYGVSKTYATNCADISDNHIAIVKDGTTTNHIVAKDISVDGIVPPLGSRATRTRFCNGATWYVWVDYDGTTNTLAARVSNKNTRPASADVSTSINLASYFGNTTAVYFGFTAATGGSWASHNITSFYFNNKYSTSGLSPATVTYQVAGPPAKPVDMGVVTTLGEKAIINPVSTEGVDYYLLYDSRTSQNPIASGTTLQTPNSITSFPATYYYTAVSTSGLQSSDRGVITVYNGLCTLTTIEAPDNACSDENSDPAHKDHLRITANIYQPDAIYSITISWGSLTFEYSRDGWDTQTHTYSSSGWSIPSDESNQIHIINHSNQQVNIELQGNLYESSSVIDTRVLVKFYTDSAPTDFSGTGSTGELTGGFTLASAVGTPVDNAPGRSVYVLLTGNSPPALAAYTEAGSGQSVQEHGRITVTIL